MKPLVSVVIPVLADPAGLESCLGALSTQTFPEDRCEIIVVNNGPAGSVERVCDKFARVRTTFELKPTSYAARNTGIGLARGDIFAFTDADCIPSPDWIANGVDALARHPDCGLVGGRIEVFPRRPGQPTAIELYDLLYGLDQARYIQQGRFAATANLFTRRSVFDDVGLFDANIKSGGDLLWGQRVSRRYPLVYCENVSVRHPAKSSVAALYRRCTRIVGGMHDLQRRGISCSYTGMGENLLRDALPPLRASARALSNSGLGNASKRIRLVGVLFLVQYAQLLERTRLALGKPSRR